MKTYKVGIVYTNNDKLFNQRTEQIVEAESAAKALVQALALVDISYDARHVRVHVSPYGMDECVHCGRRFDASPKDVEPVCQHCLREYRRSQHPDWRVDESEGNN